MYTTETWVMLIGGRELARARVTTNPAGRATKVETRAEYVGLFPSAATAWRRDVENHAVIRADAPANAFAYMKSCADWVRDGR